jgi:hypothetical protein
MQGFFLGFGREAHKRCRLVWQKCKGEGVEIVNFFSINCEGLVMG